jgi:hypothetical protein
MPTHTPTGKKFPKREFRVGQWVITKSGLRGKVIGSALYFNGYEYRIKVPGKPKMMYRKENDLKVG